MLYMRTKGPARELPVSTVRLLATATLIAYPLGALAIRFIGTLPAVIGGYALIVGALAGLAGLTGTSVQKIVAEQPDQLDEYQLRLRARAFTAAYTALSALVLIATIAAAIAADKGGWLPRSYDEFNGLFWGIFLYATVLPTLCLAWQLDPADEEEDA